VCSFSALMICSSVNLLLRICPSPEGNGFYPKTGAFKGSRSDGTMRKMSSLCHSDRYQGGVVELSNFKASLRHHKKGPRVSPHTAPYWATFLEAS
jgi:hypothetical protein